MQKPPIETESSLDETHDQPIFESQEHLNREIVRLFYGDLCVIGRLWIHALRTALVGANLSLIPVVKAAKKDGPPKRPPKMKYKDLPIYECPHNEYKDYLADKRKCPNSNVKILHTYLFPTVSRVRKEWADSIRDFNKDARELRDDACAEVCKKKKEFIAFMRCRDNLMIRQGVVLSGTAAGYFVGRGAGVLRRLFFTTAGALAAGALCFPKETDEIVREASFKIGKFALSMFNGFCGMNLALRERIPCPEDMPPPPPKRPDNQKNKCDDPKKK